MNLLDLSSAIIVIVCVVTPIVLIYWSCMDDEDDCDVVSEEDELDWEENNTRWRDEL